VLERSEWRPVLSINSVVFALQLLFVEPNPLPEHTANFIAATTLRNNAAEFAAQVGSDVGTSLVSFFSFSLLLLAHHAP